MKRIVLQDLINERPLGFYQKIIVALCMVLMILDGYDTQAMAYAAPLLQEHWLIDKTELGMVMSAALAGLFLGSLVLSNLSDRFGRRPVLLVSTLAFSTFTLLTPSVGTIEQLALMRFLAGLFLGGVMPNAMAYCSEIVPARRRVFIMIVISAGFTLGAALGGVVASWLKHYGWSAIFYFGGMLPLILCILLALLLPESPKFLASRPGNTLKILSSLRRFYPSFNFEDDVVIVTTEEIVAKPSALMLFSQKHAFFTTTVWIISILNMLSLYFLSSWLPTLNKDAGFSTSNALIIGSVLQFGGLMGSVAMGRYISRLGFYKIMIPAFMLATVSVGMIGISTGSVGLMYLVVFVAGFTVVGGQPAINALSAEHYPSALRTTGVGWSIGIGRVGSMIGPFLGGMLANSMNMPSLFLVAAIPSVLIIIVLLIQANHSKHPEPEPLFKP